MSAANHMDQAARRLQFEHGVAGLACPVCGSADTGRWVRAAHHSEAAVEVSYARCRSCLCLFTGAFGNAYAQPEAQALKYYMEIGAGVEPMARMISAALPASLGSFADVGCGAGFSLDFVRTVYGAHVLGFEPNPYGRAAGLEGEVLALPLDQAWLGRDPRRFDMVMACEVIEHVDDPLAFARALRAALAGEAGVVVLSTPAAESVAPGGDPLQMYSSLFPGEHRVLFSSGALETLLRKAGFAHVEVRLQDGHTLVATASPSMLVLAGAAARQTAGAPADRAATPYRRYLEAAWQRSDPASESAYFSGHSYRLFKDLVNGGDMARARQVLERSAVLRALVDEQLIVAEGVAAAALAQADFSAYVAGGPAYLGPFAFCCAMLARLEGRIVAASTGLERAARLLRHEQRIAPLLFLEAGSLILPCRIEHMLLLAHAGRADDALAAWREIAIDPAVAAPALAEISARLVIELNAGGAYRQIDEIVRRIDATRADGNPLVRALQSGDLAGTEARHAVTIFDLWVCRFYLALNHHADRSAREHAFSVIEAIHGAQPGLGKLASLQAVRKDHGAKPAAAPRASGKPPAVVHFIDQLWCDTHGVYAKGWVHAYQSEVAGVRLCSGPFGERAALHPRPDVVAFYPDYPLSGNYGFSAYLACPPFQPVELEIATASGTARIKVEVPPHLVPAIDPSPEPADDPSSVAFRAAMKQCRGTVLVLGGRQGEAHSDLWSQSLLPECRVISVDIHPGTGVDVVADAHFLSKTFAPGSIDGVMSISVFEHLEAPWVVAAEINKVLRVGGLTMHHAPQAWPMHATPNDFWRYSADGLRVLFGPALGFEVLYAAMSSPARIHPDPQLRKTSYASIEMPVFDSFQNAAVLSKKVAEVAAGAVAWPSLQDQMLVRAQQYPR